ncbi:hypothetical protein AAE478_007054 [Parahypoxylon ruwenzoriense]
MATFTALNGGEQKSADVPSGSPTSIRAVSEEERSVRQITAQEPRVGEASSSQREHWSGPSSDRQSYQPSTYPSAEGLHKRKRSLSDDSQREGPIARDREQQAQVESRDAYAAPKRDREYGRYGEESREHHESWYAQAGHVDDRNAYDQQSSTGFTTSPTEEPIGDTPRRPTAHMEPQHDYPATSPDGDDSSVVYGGTYTAEQRKGETVIQADPKKRKRNFSNRTKTG